MLRLLLATLCAAITIGVLMLEGVVHLRDPAVWVRASESAGLASTLAADVVPRETRARVRATWPGAGDAAIGEVDAVLREVVTAEWLLGRQRDAAAALLPWLFGERDGVSVRIVIRDRIEAAGAALEDRVENSPLFASAWDRLTGFAADAIVGRQGALPFGIAAEPGAWRAAIRTAAPLEWVTKSLATQVDQAVGWLTGDRPRFAIVLPLQEQRQAVADAIGLLVGRSNALVFLRRHVIRPAILERLSDVELVHGSGVLLRPAEVADALGELIDTPWVQDCRDDIVRTTAEYLSGRTETLELRVPLDKLVGLVSERIATLVLVKVRATVATRPPCTFAQARALLAGDGDPLGCRLSALEEAAGVALLAAHVKEQIAAAVKRNVPAVWHHGEQQIQALLSPGTWSLIQRARRWMRHGVRIDEGLLRQLLHEHRLELIDRILVVTRTGLILDTSDVTQVLFGADRRQVDRLRAVLARVHVAQLALLAVLALLVFLLLFGRGPAWLRALIALSAPVTGAAIGTALALVAPAAGLAELGLPDLVAPVADALQLEALGRVAELGTWMLAAGLCGLVACAIAALIDRQGVR